MTPAPISVERLRELLAVSSLRLPLCQFGAHVDGADGDTVADCYYNAAHEQDGRDVAELFAAAVNALPALLHQLAELQAINACTMGVGDGSGRLFVHGDYESIKAAQEIVTKLAERDADVERIQATLVRRTDALHAWKSRAESAERARDEAEIMLSVFTTLGAQVTRTSCGRYRINSEPETDRGTARESIAAFLAASGGKVDG